MIEWLLLTFMAIFVQALFALFEMASVSLNKVRLHYAASKGSKRAQFLEYLLQRPSRLFGMTLISINAALQIGSECARRVYESMRIDPDWAPVSQVVLVVVFAELIPLFTARRHPQQIAMALSPVMIFFAKFLSPVIWLFDKSALLIHRLIGKPEETPLFLSREEVSLAFEESEDEFTALIRSTFQLKALQAGSVMQPLAEAQPLVASATVGEIRERFAKQSIPTAFAVYQKLPQYIFGVVAVRDLIGLESHQPIIERAKSPWFVTQETPVLQILSQFRKNGQTLAVILDSSGQAVGLLTLDQVVDAIFGPETMMTPETLHGHFVERTLNGQIRLSEFNKQFGASLQGNGDERLESWILRQLGSAPAKGETVRVNGYEFVIIEPTVRGIRTLLVRSVVE